MGMGCKLAMLIMVVMNMNARGFNFIIATAPYYLDFCLRIELGMGVQTRAARRARVLTDGQTRVLKPSSIRAGHI